MLTRLHSDPHLSQFLIPSLPFLFRHAFPLEEGISDTVWKHIFLKGNAAAKLFIFFFS